MRLLTGVMDRGATTAEVYWKEGRSIRFALSASAELTESHVEERGVAVRAWGPAGEMAFASFIPDDDACTSHALEGIRMQMLGPGEGPPTLPCSPPHALTPDGGSRLGDMAARIREMLLPMKEAFGGRGRQAVSFETAWAEAGESRITLVNSRGFEGSQQLAGWNLALAARATRGNDARMGYLGRGGRVLPEMDAGALVSEICWRTAAPLGGESAPPGNVKVLIDATVASQLLQSLSSLFVASPATVVSLANSEKIGPPSLRIQEAGCPKGVATGEAWDGEGIPVRSVPLVEKGRIANLLTDLSSSRRFDLPPTGSAKRLSFRDMPEAAPTRLILTLEGKERQDLVRNVDDLLGRLDPGLFLTTGRFIASDVGTGGALVGGGIWIDGGRAVHPIRRGVIPAGPIELLRALLSSTPPEGGWAESAESGSLLVVTDVFPG